MRAVVDVGQAPAPAEISFIVRAVVGVGQAAPAGVGRRRVPNKKQRETR